ncbi:MAG: hypothetical protein ABIJ24_05360 [Nitrospinota bacterium]
MMFPYVFYCPNAKHNRHGIAVSVLGALLDFSFIDIFSVTNPEDKDIVT